MGKPSSETFPVGTRSKIFLSTTAVYSKHLNIKYTEYTGDQTMIIPSLKLSLQKSFNQSVQFIKSFMAYTWF